MAGDPEIYFENNSKIDGLSDEEMQAASLMIVKEALSVYGCPYECSVNVYLTDEEEIREMNSENRGIDSATDVLSFPNLPFTTENKGDFDILSDYSDADIMDPETGKLLLGDIVICAAKVMSQAEEYGHSVKREFAFLVCHSILHLLGFDHMEDADREEMESAQRLILENTGYTRDK